MNETQLHDTFWFKHLIRLFPAKYVKIFLWKYQNMEYYENIFQSLNIHCLQLYSYILSQKTNQKQEWHTQVTKTLQFALGLCVEIHTYSLQELYIYLNVPFVASPLFQYQLQWLLSVKVCKVMLVNLWGTINNDIKEKWNTKDRTP